MVKGQVFAYPALMTPTIHSFRSGFGPPTKPNSSGKDKLAPLDPVWSHPLTNWESTRNETKSLWTYWTAAARLQMTTVMYKARG